MSASPSPLPPKTLHTLAFYFSRLNHASSEKQKRNERQGREHVSCNNKNLLYIVSDLYTLYYPFRFRKFGPPYLGKASAAARAELLTQSYKCMPGLGVWSECALCKVDIDHGISVACTVLLFDFRVHDE